MERKNDDITISLEVFRSIVEKEVQKHITREDGVEKERKYPQQLFAGLNNHNLANINKRHNVTGFEEWIAGVDGEKLWLSKRKGTFNFTEKKGTHFYHSKTELHEQVRALVLTVFGARINSEVQSFEYEQAREAYEKINNLAHDIYEERLKTLDEKGIKVFKKGEGIEGK